MQVVILAAGTGNRLIHLTRELPKALVEVRDRPLIDYAVEFALSLSPKEILVVGGFHFVKLRSHLEASAAPVTLLENTEYLKGNLFTLLCALPRLDGDTLLMNVDHLYPGALGRRFLASRGDAETIMPFVDFDRPLGADDMKVAMDGEGALARISKSLAECDGGYIGMTYVPAGRLGAYRAAAAAVALASDDSVAEDVLQHLIHTGETIGIFRANDVRWLEVDNLQDLKNAGRILTRVPGFLD